MGIGLGDVTTIFMTLTAMGIAFPGLVLACALLLPGTVERGSARARQTPGRTFALGLLWLVPNALVIAALMALPSVSQFLGFALLFANAALAVVGAAGIALLMGERLRQSGITATSPGALVRGAVALELAVVFPIIGWFIVFPLVLVLSLGAALWALVRRGPRPTAAPERALVGGLGNS